MLPLADLPRFPLLDGPSPLQPLHRFSEALGNRAEVWIKREDLLPLAFGGNKLRNLEFLVGRALADGADTLVTSGRRWSNHCRLTAAAGARAGLGVHLVLGGPPRNDDGPNVRLERLLGATIHVAPTGDRADREALVGDVTAALRSAGRRPFTIEVGGSGVTGAVGQVLAGQELVEQARKRAAEPHSLIVPSATGGTQAGLLWGLRYAGCAARVIGVAVAQPPDELRARVAAILDGLADLTGAEPPAEAIEVDADYLAPGYGRRNGAAEEATELLARTEGILVDPIYTAKALAALIAAVRSGRHDGRAIVFWHAGGTPGVLEPLD